ncbi:MAG: aromatic-ring-hydroxylating dioxygenase subunit beta [Janthinobacterium lividum]
MMNESNTLAAASFSSAAFAAATRLIWREAELLDRKNYTAWLDLWTTGGFYVIPIDPDTEDFAASLNYVYDDQTMRGLRVERMSGGYSASASDAARTVRSVSRFVAGELTDDIIEIRSSQIVAANKRGVTTLFGADLTHRIRVANDQAWIVDKVIRLIDSHEALSAIGFLL